MSGQTVVRGSVFLSHNRADKPFVHRLAKRLGRAHVATWVDDAEMLVGDSLLEKVQKGIAEMEYLGVVLSPDSVDSEWVQRELKMALTLEISHKSVRVLPILYRDCEIPGFLRDKLYADFRGCDTDPSIFEGSVEHLLNRLLPKRGNTRSDADTFLEESVRQWKAAGLLLDKGRLDYLFQHRHVIKLADTRWLTVAESAFAAKQFERWMGMVGDAQVWSAIHHTLVTSENDVARCEAARYLGAPNCAQQSGYLAFVSKFLCQHHGRSLREALVAGVAAIEDKATFDRVLTPFTEKAVTPDLQRMVVRIVHRQFRWYARLGAEFFLGILEAPLPIDEATHDAFDALASLGDTTAIPRLKALHADGYEGNESIGEAYLDKIEETLRILGDDTSVLKRPF